MNVLAFDACLGAVSVALRWRDAAGAWSMREACEEMTGGHAERLLPMIGVVMSDAGLAFGDLDRIAVVRGPGSFTGVRAAVAAARGLAVARGLPVVGMSSLAVFARQAAQKLDAGESRPLAIVIEARRDALYLQLFAADGEAELSPPGLLAPDEAVARLARGGWIAAGSGAALLARAAEGHADIAVEARWPKLQPHARTLALLAPALTPMTPIEPLYIRSPDAKPQTGQSLPRIA